MRFIRTFVTGFLILASLLLAVFLGSQSKTFQDCEADKTPKSASKPSGEQPPILFAYTARDSLIVVECEGSVFDEHNGTIVAVFTTILAVFTWRLAVSTEKLWSAGEKQIKAAVRAADAAERTVSDIERPYIFVFKLRWRDETENENPDQPVLEYRVANFGRTPAIIESVTLAYGPISAFNGIFTFEDSLDTVFEAPIITPMVDRVISKVWFTSSGSRFVVSSDGTRERVPEEFFNVDHHFAVKIRYRGPFTQGHETCARWRYDRGLHAFTAFDDKAYNYTK